LTYPSEKYDFVSWDDVPNHQPVMGYNGINHGMFLSAGFRWPIHSIFQAKIVIEWDLTNKNCYLTNKMLILWGVQW
jgi:hypothetical protein